MCSAAQLHLHGSFCKMQTGSWRVGEAAHRGYMLNLFRFQCWSWLPHMTPQTLAPYHSISKQHFVFSPLFCFNGYILAYSMHTGTFAKWHLCFCSHPKLFSLCADKMWRNCYVTPAVSTVQLILYQRKPAPHSAHRLPPLQGATALGLQLLSLHFTAAFVQFTAMSTSWIFQRWWWKGICPIFDMALLALRHLCGKHEKIPEGRISGIFK